MTTYAEIPRRARQMLDHHGLQDWQFMWINTRRILGQCHYGEKQIRLSRYVAQQNSWKNIEQVILHEIAHALAGAEAKHNDEWKRVALSIGVVNPKHCTNEIVVQGRYQATCERCGTVYHRHRWTPKMADRLACFKCCREHNGGYFTRKFLLTYVDTSLTRHVQPSSVASMTTTEEHTKTEWSAPELAARIGTDPKTFRRFLRENDSWRSPGSGGRYKFTEKEAVAAERAFADWRNKRPTRRKSSQGDSRAKNKTQRTSDARARVDALEQSLLARGVHISQHS